MNLEEIEAKADEYATGLIETPNASMVRHYRDKLEGLSHAARIKATVAYRKEQALPNLKHPTYPTPVADRLHELVSYCREREEYKGRDNEIGADTAYGDVADKLQEILQEGGI